MIEAGSEPPGLHRRERTPRVITEQPARVDRIFGISTLAAGLTVLVLLALVGVFLFLRSGDALSVAGWSFFTTESFSPNSDPPVLGVLGMLTGTVIVGVMAVLVAIPLSVCAALFITQYASRRARSFLGGLVDLLAAIPSLLFGLWGFIYLSDELVPIQQWLNRWFGWFPPFATVEGRSWTGTMFIAAMVVALMVLPIITSISREVFAQAPPGEQEAALALGGTRWGMIRTVVLPYGRGGLIGGSMLGLGRALGETIAVALLLPQIPEVTVNVLQNGGATISGFIAQNAGSGPFATSGLMAAGLVLFGLTLVTNFLASVVVSRSRSGVGVEL